VDENQTLAVLLRQKAQSILDFPSTITRNLSDPQAFLKQFGYTPNQQLSGFSAGYAGVPEQPPSDIGVLDPKNIAYNKGYSSGEDTGLMTALALPFAPLAKPVAKAAGRQAWNATENMMQQQGLMPSIVPLNRKEILEQNFNKIAGGEKPVRSAVVLIGDKIFTGNTHTQAFEKAIHEGVVRKEGKKFIYPEGAEVNSDLFMLNDGSIVDRLTASRKLDVGSSEGALRDNKMQIRPANSMPIDEYMRQAKIIKESQK
jgi:hypothetical protein